MDDFDGLRAELAKSHGTVAALRDALARRPEPKAATDAGLVFVTKYGRPWVKAEAVRADPVAQEFGKLMEQIGVSHKGVGFYALRHTFRTVADATKDANALRPVMGHTDDRIDATYTLGIDDGRVVELAEHVRAWLYPPNSAGPAHSPVSSPKSLRFPSRKLGHVCDVAVAASLSQNPGRVRFRCRPRPSGF